MRRFTDAGCIESLKAAYAVNSPDVRQYIERQAAKRRQRSMAARKHSMLLLQIKTTGSIETWHSRPKRVTTRMDSLEGSIRRVEEVASVVDKQRAKTAFVNSSKDVSESQFSGHLSRFLLVIQKLMVKEIRSVETMMMEGSRFENSKRSKRMQSLAIASSSKGNEYSLIMVTFKLSYLL